MGDKVLLLETLGADYGAYMLAKGFCDWLGSDRVRMWPYKNTYNGGRDQYPVYAWDHRGSEPGKPGDVINVAANGKIGYVPAHTGAELWAHEALWRAWDPNALRGAYMPIDIPIHFASRPLGIPFAQDDEIMEMVRQSEFGLIVLNGARWHGSAALHELQARHANLPPIAFVDHEDYPQERVDFVNAFKPAAYFKRTLLRTDHPNRYMLGRAAAPVYPMPFSSLWDIPWVPWKERTTDVFCVLGSTQAMRKLCRQTTEEAVAACPGWTIRAAIGHVMKHDEYLRSIAHSKVVIDQQSFGTDTVRFWEGISAGALVITDSSIEMPSSKLEPGHHFLRYDNDLSPMGDRQSFAKLREHILHAYANDAHAEEMARAGYETLRANHKCVDRAMYIARTLRELGHSMDGMAH